MLSVLHTVHDRILNASAVTRSIATDKAMKSHSVSSMRCCSARGEWNLNHKDEKSDIGVCCHRVGRLIDVGHGGRSPGRGRGHDARDPKVRTWAVQPTRGESRDHTRRARDAEAAFFDGEYTRAVAEVSKAIFLQDSDPRFYALRADALAELGDLNVRGAGRWWAPSLHLAPPPARTAPVRHPEPVQSTVPLRRRRGGPHEARPRSRRDGAPVRCYHAVVDFPPPVTHRALHTCETTCSNTRCIASRSPSSRTS